MKGGLCPNYQNQTTNTKNESIYVITICYHR